MMLVFMVKRTILQFVHFDKNVYTKGNDGTH